MSPATPVEVNSDAPNSDAPTADAVAAKPASDKPDVPASLAETETATPLSDAGPSLSPAPSSDSTSSAPKKKKKKKKKPKSETESESPTTEDGSAPASPASAPAEAVDGMGPEELRADNGKLRAEVETLAERARNAEEMEKMVSEGMEKAMGLVKEKDREKDTLQRELTGLRGEVAGLNEEKKQFEKRGVLVKALGGNLSEEREKKDAAEKKADDFKKELERVRKESDSVVGGLKKEVEELREWKANEERLKVVRDRETKEKETKEKEAKAKEALEKHEREKEMETLSEEAGKAGGREAVAGSVGAGVGVIVGVVLRSLFGRGKSD